VLNATTIQITWNNAAADPPAELIARSQADRRFGRRDQPKKALRASSATA